MWIAIICAAELLLILYYQLWCTSLFRRYNPENLSVLEPYVRQQIIEDFHDISANLAVLKLW